MKTKIQVINGVKCVNCDFGDEEGKVISKLIGRSFVLGIRGPFKEGKIGEFSIKYQNLMAKI